MSGVALVVLDCDGVILESVAVKTWAFHRLFLGYGEAAAQRMIDYHMANGGVSRFRKFAWFYQEVLGRVISTAEEAALNERFTGYCLEGVLNAPFVPGAYEFITGWHMRLPLYVASGTPHDELMMILDQKGVSEYFKGIYGSPPDKTGLLGNIIRRNEVLPGRVLMVGDSHTDLEAALATGTRFFGRGITSGRPGDGWGEDLNGLTAYIRDLARQGADRG